ncbi:hypothetical protein L6452_07457 [Arctium lappa]|uniref:Uncharacterized protein n=1 Tax=Arctium lappa TaxID=4217 RepID=A0ACB9ELP6_ARCLA|nr:hypothetical protein L6452_07457 [Arctium lappa]
MLPYDIYLLIRNLTISRKHTNRAHFFFTLSFSHSKLTGIHLLSGQISCFSDIVFSVSVQLVDIIQVKKKLI